jgi:uncharacterized membrane protein
MIVAFAGFVSLFFPIRPVVVYAAALPVIVILTLVRFASALKRAVSSGAVF